MIDALTLDQLRVFVAVAETGSFSAAGRRLRRAQSAISRTVATLEAGTGVVLFDRSSYTPRLTEEGQALLAEAKVALASVERFRAQAGALAADVEARLGIAAVLSVPTERLIPILTDLKTEFPQLPVALHTGSIGAVIDLVLDGTCSLGICACPPEFPFASVGAALERVPIQTAIRVAVAAPDHPLVQFRGRIPEAELRRHTQLLITDKNPRTADIGFKSHHAWSISDFHSKRQFLLAGFGWGAMPLHLVEDDIRSGRLKRLHLPDYPDWRMPIPVFLIFHTRRPPGRAGAWLIPQFCTRLFAGPATLLNVG